MDRRAPKVEDMEYTHEVKMGIYPKQKGSRGAYLQWLDEAIKSADDGYGEAHDSLTKQYRIGVWEALVEARKAFTDEFYPK